MYGHAAGSGGVLCLFYICRRNGEKGCREAAKRCGRGFRREADGKWCYGEARRGAAMALATKPSSDGETENARTKGAPSSVSPASARRP